MYNIYILYIYTIYIYYIYVQYIYIYTVYTYILCIYMYTFVHIPFMMMLCFVHDALTKISQLFDKEGLHFLLFKA